MKVTENHNNKVAQIPFNVVYPMYITKVEKKGRTIKELGQVIEWLTGFSENKIKELSKQEITFEKFFEQAKLNPNAHMITGVICGYRIEDIENTLTRKVRYLDKLVDELAKGRDMNKILRK